MHTVNVNVFNCLLCRKSAAALLTLSLLIIHAQPTFADYSGVGNVSGTVDPGGGPTGDLEIGISDLGGLQGDDEQVFGGVNPLETTSANVGVTDLGIGAITLTGFVSQWDISGDLTLGDAGQGFLSFGISATVDVGGDTILGAQATGQGIVDISGATFPGARLRTTGQLIVGDLGTGNISVSTRGSLFSETDAIVGNQDGGDGIVSLTDVGTRWSVQGDLTIGNGTTDSTAHGIVEISNDALLQTEAAVTINPFGHVVLLGGTLRALDVAGATTGTVTNGGLILGDGFIDGAIDIDGSGEIRNAFALVQNGPTVTNEREFLKVSGLVDNDGTIQSLGGAMEFEALVTNNLEIVARDAEMHFRAGVFNTGIITLGGDTTLHTGASSGGLTIAGGSLLVLPSSESLLVGDLVFTASSVLGLTIGEDAGTLDVTGMADLNDAIFALDYASQRPSQVGDSYQIFHAGGGITGTFPASAVADGRLWDIDMVGSSLFATATGGAPIAMGPDFNGDGIVNALDLAIWEANFGAMGPAGSLDAFGDADMDGDVDGGDYFQIVANFGMPFPVSAAATAVPEPSTCALALLALACCRRRPARS